MLIKSVKLHNIRSYLESKIELPKGSVLLSGDIGSGKSTVLLATEFALFGLQRGLLDGASLLRSNKKEGFVELELEINNKVIKIKRELKREKKSVVQGNATINIDGTTKELAATELKQFILNTLNYPSGLLTKRNLIYRFTVYTPQEEMKRILLEKPETRLDTLRKVFDVDKYKRIKDSCEIFLNQLKEKKKEKEGQLVDLPFKQEQLSKKEKESKENEKKINELKPKLANAKKRVKQIKDLILKQENEIEKFKLVRENLAKTETKHGEKIKQLNEINNEIKELEKLITSLKNELSKLKYQDKEKEKIKKSITEQEQLLKNLRAKEKLIEKELSSFTTRKQILEKDIHNISDLKTCPVCKQEVTSEHRKKITSEINQELVKLNKQFNEKNKSLQELSDKLETVEKQVQDLNEEEKIVEIAKIKFQNFNEKQKQKLKLIKTSKQIDEEIKTLADKKNEYEKTLKETKELELKHKKTREQLETEQEKEHVLALDYKGIEKGKENILKEMSELKIEINKKLKVKSALEELKKLQNWLNKDFLFIADTIEKQVMANLNAEFNLLFQKWFEMLVEDENLKTRTDFDFTPSIEQEGYEINYNYLSGGERTALALAYRLALNQVINSMLSKLATRNLLILDEPTDGFSSEQLDKMRDVLQELKAEQLILVSHETKIESFVEHIIRFQKQGHVSRVEM